MWESRALKIKNKTSTYPSIVRICPGDRQESNLIQNVPAPFVEYFPSLPPSQRWLYTVEPQEYPQEIYYLYKYCCDLYFIHFFDGSRNQLIIESLNAETFETSMHSSRMRTARRLIVSKGSAFWGGSLPSERGLPSGGGVCLLREGLPAHGIVGRHSCRWKHYVVTMLV